MTSNCGVSNLMVHEKRLPTFCLKALFGRWSFFLSLVLLLCLQGGARHDAIAEEVQSQVLPLRGKNEGESDAGEQEQRQQQLKGFMNGKESPEARESKGPGSDIGRIYSSKVSEADGLVSDNKLNVSALHETESAGDGHNVEEKGDKEIEEIRSTALASEKDGIPKDVEVNRAASPSDHGISELDASDTDLNAKEVLENADDMEDELEESGVSFDDGDKKEGLQNLAAEEEEVEPTKSIFKDRFFKKYGEDDHQEEEDSEEYNEDEDDAIDLESKPAPGRDNEEAVANVDFPGKQQRQEDELANVAPDVISSSADEQATASTLQEQQQQRLVGASREEPAQTLEIPTEQTKPKAEHFLSPSGTTKTTEAATDLAHRVGALAHEEKDHISLEIGTTDASAVAPDVTSKNLRYLPAVEDPTAPPKSSLPVLHKLTKILKLALEHTEAMVNAMFGKKIQPLPSFPITHGPFLSERFLTAEPLTIKVEAPCRFVFHINPSLPPMAARLFIEVGKRLIGVETHKQACRSSNCSCTRSVYSSSMHAHTSVIVDESCMLNEDLLKSRLVGFTPMKEDCSMLLITFPSIEHVKKHEAHGLPGDILEKLEVEAGIKSLTAQERCIVSGRSPTECKELLDNPKVSCAFGENLLSSSHSALPACEF